MSRSESRGRPSVDPIGDVARGGVTSFVGLVASAALGFLIVVIVTNGFGTTVVGTFFETVALFNLAVGIAVWGADIGVIRTIPRFRTLDRENDVRPIVRLAGLTVVLAAIAIAAIVFLFAPKLAEVLDAGDAVELERLIRAAVPFVPIAAVYAVDLAATRGLGSMSPTTVIDRIGRTALQLLGVLLVALAGLGATALVLGWAVPYGFCCVVAVLWLARALSSRGAVAPPSGTAGTLFAEFWRFAAPRGLAGVFAVIVLWLDTLLIGALRSASEAGIYAAAVRYLAFGAFASQAIVQAIAPTMSRLLTAGEIGVARSVYRAGTAWSMLFGWPVYFLLVIFAPALLSIFGQPYVAAQDALTILATTMLIATAVGPVDVVLLMAGKSGWNLMNTLGALIVNVGLNIALIPRWGIAGAAIAWSVSILTNNLAPLAQLWKFLHLDPFGRETVSVAVAATTSFAVIPLAVRLAFGPSVMTFAIASILGLGLYVLLLWRIRDSARLEQLFAMRARFGLSEHS